MTEKEDSLWGLIDLGLYFSKMLFMTFVALTSELEFPNLKDSDAGRDWGQEEKGTTEDEMAGWHH